MEKVKLSYYGGIPVKLRYDENLNDGQKLLYGKTTTLTNKLEKFGVQLQVSLKWFIQKGCVYKRHILDKFIYFVKVIC